MGSKESHVSIDNQSDLPCLKGIKIIIRKEFPEADELLPVGYTEFLTVILIKSYLFKVFRYIDIHEYIVDLVRLTDCHVFILPIRIHDLDICRTVQ